MHRSRAAEKSGGVEEVRVGNVTLKIYRSTTRGRPLFTLAYRGTDNRRVKKSFADLGKAKAEAYAAAAKIQSGQLDVLELKSADRISYQHALAALKPTGQQLASVATQYAEAFKILNGVGSIAEAARFFVKHHAVALPKKSVSAVYEEFLAAKKADRASPRYIQDIRSRLGRLARHFSGPIAETTGQELEVWVQGLECGPVARNSVRSLVITLFNYARQRGYLPKNQPTEAESVSIAKEPPSPIGIFQPDQMRILLREAGEEILPYLAIGAFGGLRHAEMMRLDWGDVKLREGHIEVTAKNSKTAQRRIVVIQRNFGRWLKPYSGKTGRVFRGDGSRFLNMVTRRAKELGVPWPQNGLRHSFASYRLAQCKNAAEVALEMGNSPRIVFQHYRELVPPAAAKKWWSIAPGL